MQFEYCGQISKITQTSNFMEISRLEAELFHAEGRTVSHDEANSH